MNSLNKPSQLSRATIEPLEESETVIYEPLSATVLPTLNPYRDSAQAIVGKIQDQLRSSKDLKETSKKRLNLVLDKLSRSKEHYQMVMEAAKQAGVYHIPMRGKPAIFNVPVAKSKSSL